MMMSRRNEDDNISVSINTQQVWYILCVTVVSQVTLCFCYCMFHFCCLNMYIMYVCGRLASSSSSFFLSSPASLHFAFAQPFQRFACSSSSFFLFSFYLSLLLLPLLPRLSCTLPLGQIERHTPCFAGLFFSICCLYLHSSDIRWTRRCHAWQVTMSQLSCRLSTEWTVFFTSW